MDEETKQPSHPVTWFASVAGAIVAYPLSVGPVAWALVRIGPGRPDWFYVLYRPLIWLDANSAPFHQFIHWYEKLWGF